MILPDQNRTHTLDSDTNIIPLINVVFLMLIFFMVAGQIQSVSRIELPDSISNVRPIEPSISAVVDASGQIWLDDVPVSVEALKSIIQTEVITNDSVAQLLLEVDAQLPAVELHQLLLMLKAAALTKVSLATQLGELS